VSAHQRAPSGQNEPRVPYERRPDPATGEWLYTLYTFVDSSEPNDHDRRASLNAELHDPEEWRGR
jgi:hypothetical protein